jgi:hypothetical protein
MTTTDTQLAQVIEEAVKALEDVATPSGVKPVALAQIVGVREQMVYNYINAKRINATHNDGGYWRIKVADAQKWATEYLTRKYNKDS